MEIPMERMNDLEQIKRTRKLLLQTYVQEREQEAQRINVIKRTKIAIAILIWIAIFAFAFMSCNKVHADVNQSRAVNAIIGEAEGEGYDGMKAIACAIRNRGTLKGVYGEKAPRVLAHKYSDNIEAKALVAWTTSEDPKECAFLKGADHWGGATIDQKWIAKMERSGFVRTAQIKNTIFYRRKQ